MGYKKAFSLLTIQLMLPLSTMTKEAYKDTYGIDLNDIDFEKVSLLQKDGSKEKYYVDEVKVTADGADIYAGGNIFSIGATSVSVIENAYSVENSKPLYFHPISLIQSTDSAIQWYESIIIINNSPDPIDTIDKLFAFFNSVFDSLPDGVNTARFPCTGTVASDTEWQITSSCEVAGKTNTARKFVGRHGTSGATSIITFDDLDYMPRVFDGVNKIN